MHGSSIFLLIKIMDNNMTLLLLSFLDGEIITDI